MKSRLEVTEAIMATKVTKDIKWADVAEQVGQSKEWVTAACLGQMVLNEAQANKVVQIFELPDTAAAWLQAPPFKGGLPDSIPTDPLLYRFHEITHVYGMSIKELVHEEFGDGIMSAIDFYIKINREEHENGDRVNIVFSGKFLPFKTF